MPKVPQINKTKYMPDHGPQTKTIVCFRGERPVYAAEGKQMSDVLSQVHRHHKPNKGQQGV
jgi:hypothetical protein